MGSLESGLRSRGLEWLLKVALEWLQKLSLEWLLKATPEATLGGWLDGDFADRAVTVDKAIEIECRLANKADSTVGSAWCKSELAAVDEPHQSSALEGPFVKRQVAEDQTIDA